MSSHLITHIVGARPNFIKLGSLYPIFNNYFNQIIIHTGQHYNYEMSQLFFKELNIPEPNYNLNVGSGTHGFQTGEMLKRCEKVLQKVHPDIVIVYGDTNSTLAGALASVKLKIPIAHIEAGLRSRLRYMPEEINRIIVDHISEFLFTPTKTAFNNLIKEGIRKGLYFTGDVMLDLFFKFKYKFSLNTKNFILATVHRAENTDNPKRLKNILNALIKCREKIIFPMHPRTHRCIKRYGFTWFFEAKNVKIIKPLGYINFLTLMSRSKKVVTDSGGVQKEAYFMHKPCITLREVTEWIETVKSGWNILVGSDEQKIVQAIKEFSPRGTPNLNIFGDGRASYKIAVIINKYL